MNVPSPPPAGHVREIEFKYYRLKASLFNKSDFFSIQKNSKVLGQKHLKIKITVKKYIYISQPKLCKNITLVQGRWTPVPEGHDPAEFSILPGSERQKRTRCPLGKSENPGGRRLLRPGFRRPCELKL